MDLFNKHKSTKDLVHGRSKRPQREKPERTKPPDRPKNPEQGEAPDMPANRPANMGAFFHSRTFVAIICTVLAAVIALGLLPRVYNARSNTVKVTVLRTEVEPGSTLTRDMLQTVEVGAYGLPDGVVRDPDEAVGMVAVDALYRGEYLWRGRLAASEDYEAQHKEQTKGLTGTNCLVTIASASASGGIAGVLRAGDLVDAYECKKDENGDYSIRKVFSQLDVYDVLNDDFESLDEMDKKAEASESGNVNYDFNPAYVVFLCTESTAASLIRMEKAGTLHLTLKSTGG